MSTILDALRRAEAERGRGAVPGLHTPPLPMTAAQAAPVVAAPPWRLALLIAAVLLAALGAVAGAWWLGQSAAPVPAPVTPLPVTSAPVTSAPVTSAPVTPAAVLATPAPAASPGRMGSVAPERAPEAPLPAVTVAAPVPAAPAVAAPAPDPSRTAAPAKALEPAAAVAPAVEPAPITLAALSPLQRRDWPTPAISGGVYSDNPASRFVIVGGQLVREGEVVAAGVTIDRIGPRSVVLRWRGLRVEQAL